MRAPRAPGLGSSPAPPLGPGDHVRGAGPLAILYLDLGCPRCAQEWPHLLALDLRICVRHFPLASRRPRSPALHLAAEAVATQSPACFWPFWDGLLADRSHVDDPHLWRRVEELGLDVERFETDRRSEATAERVESDFRGGIRAGVVGTPSAFVGERRLDGDELLDGLRASAGGA